MKVPCLNCNERTVGCHSTCSKYKEFRKFKDEENEKIRKEKILNSDLVEYKKDTYKRISRRTK